MARVKLVTKIFYIGFEFSSLANITSKLNDSGDSHDCQEGLTEIEN